MAVVGINWVRIPVPFWMFMTQAELDAHNEPYLTGQLPYFTRIISLLKVYNISVLIDLHAAPGSQNGFDHRYLLW
jgi:glucan 1,3-beta-glucosidase